MNKLILPALLLFQAVSANDSFYQGGGSSLRPLYNAQMRVIEEKLLIHPMPQPVCYRLKFRGRFVDEWNDLLTVSDIRPEEFVEVAGLTACPPGRVLFNSDRLLSVWQAQAEYQIEALGDQTEVLMGFPLPVWRLDSDGVSPLVAPGVANFRTFIDGKLVQNLRLTWLDVDVPNGAPIKKTLGFVWTASFKKGEKYTLRTEYDFGADYSPGFSIDENPWFIAADAVGHDAARLSLSLRYYLSPLKAWGAQAPERISIQVRRPPGVPSAYLVPVTPKPVCVDAAGLHYEYRNAYPDSELQVDMPLWWVSELWGKPETWPRMETLEQWQRWQKQLGGEGVSIACGEMDEVMPSDDFPCLQERCEGVTIEPAIMLPDFKDFPVTEIYTGKIAAPDVDSQPKARMFRTMLREHAKDGINFAGQYRVASWGCGTGCLDSGIIDAKTGRVYFDPHLETVLSGVGRPEFAVLGGPPGGLDKLNFRPDSRLLLVSGWPEKLPQQAEVVSVLAWENHALRVLYTAYGTPPAEFYGYYHNYYTVLDAEKTAAPDRLSDIPSGYDARAGFARLLACAAAAEESCDGSAADAENRAKRDLAAWQPLLPLLHDGARQAGDHAQTLAAELAAQPRSSSAKRDRKTARAANAKGLALLNSDPLKDAWKRLSLYRKEAENVDSNALAAAAELFEEGVQADPEDVELLTNLGYVYLLQGNPAGLDKLRAALLLEPARVSAWANLGMYFQFSPAVFGGSDCWEDATHLGNAAFTLSLRLSKSPDKTRAFLRRLVGERAGQDHPLLDLLDRK
jgi:hypothetical protein